MYYLESAEDDSGGLSALAVSHDLRRDFVQKGDLCQDEWQGAGEGKLDVVLVCIMSDSLSEKSLEKPRSPKADVVSMASASPESLGGILRVLKGVNVPEPGPEVAQNSSRRRIVGGEGEADVSVRRGLFQFFGVLRVFASLECF